MQCYAVLKLLNHLNINHLNIMRAILNNPIPSDMHVCIILQQDLRALEFSISKYCQMLMQAINARREMQHASMTHIAVDMTAINHKACIPAQREAK